nr:MAG TPA: tail assembly chaperone protein [Caudoviricetes sp.]
MKLDKTVTITIDGEQYKLKYDIKSLIALENLISTKNITLMAQSFPLSYGDVVSCLYVGLLEEYPSMTRKKAMNLFEKWLENDDVVNLNNLIMVALAKAGAIGYTKNYNKEDAFKVDSAEENEAGAENTEEKK